MAIEIERKFLVVGEGWRPHVVKQLRIRQGYLKRTGGSSIRVRIVDGVAATLTVKSDGAQPKRREFEYPIPLKDAREMLDLCEGTLLVKVRHLVPRDGLVWEIDVFSGQNEGLVIAEVELADEAQAVRLPGWIGREITNDPAFSNSRLVLTPFRAVESPFGADGP